MRARPRTRRRRRRRRSACGRRLRAARTILAASTPRSTTNAKSRRTGCRSDSASGGLVLVGFAFGAGMASRISSNPASGPFDVERFQHLRVELAERADHRLRPLPDRAGAAGVEPGRRVGRDLHLVGGRGRAHRGAPARRPWRRTPRRPSALPDQWRPAPLTPAVPRADAGGGGHWSSGRSPR